MVDGCENVKMDAKRENMNTIETIVDDRMQHASNTIGIKKADDRTYE